MNPIIMSKMLKNILKTHQDVIRFIIGIIACHLFWKLTISHNETNLTIYDITWFGLDISAPFITMTKHVAIAVHYILSLFESNVILENTRIIFPNNQSMNIVWACSGIKQLFIFATIIIFSRGFWKHKLWFIPLGLLICHT